MASWKSAILVAATLVVSAGFGDARKIDLGRLLNTPATRIVGGRTVQNNNPHLKWMASLQRGGSNFNFCGGSLIHQRFVMTAGHCLKYGIPDRVVVGNYNIGNKDAGEIRGVKNVVKHPKYSGVNYDVALLELDQPITNIDPVYLTNETFGDPYETEHQMLTALGWGYTKEGSGVVMDKLQRVDVPVVSQKRCRLSYSGIDEFKMCAGYDVDGKDSCSGDSGGPLFHQAEDSTITQVGIVSFGRGCARGRFYGVYARVSALLPFIKTVLSQHGAKVRPRPTSPTPAPTTSFPTAFPTKPPRTKRPTKSPTSYPTKRPITPRPSKAPTRLVPTVAPTSYPTRYAPVNRADRSTFRYCATRVNKTCRRRRKRCFWNNAGKNQPLVKGFVAKACLPNNFRNRNFGG